MFKKYRHKESGEIVEMEKMVFLTNPPKYKVFKEKASPENEYFWILCSEFERQYEPIE